MVYLSRVPTSAIRWMRLMEEALILASVLRIRLCRMREVNKLYSASCAAKHKSGDLEDNPHNG